MMIRAFVLGAVVSIAMSHATALAQQTESTTLHATSTLVELNVLVHDSKGAPIRDLTKDDFVVLDQGRSRPIAFFRMAEQRATPAVATDSHSLILNNRSLTPTERPASATVLFVDSLSSDDLLYVKRELPKFLKKLQPGDAVAIYALSGLAVKVVHEFSESPESLIRSVERIPTTGSGRRKTRIQAEWTLTALQVIAQHLADIPGRKTLVWISNAFPIQFGFTHTEGLAGGAATFAGAKQGDLNSYLERLKALGRTLNHVDIAMYPVDPRGLTIDAQYEASALPGSKPSRVIVPTRFQSEGENNLGEFATMDLIAAETGGHAFYNANALGDSIQRAVDDSRVTYVLGFYPDAASWDGTSHKLEVRVNRPGVEVRSRRSYFASDTHVESQPERELALQAVASTALNGTAIGVTANVASNPLKPGMQQIEVSVAPEDVRFENKDGKWRADFDLILAQQAPDGRRVAGERSQCVVDRDSYAETQTKALAFRRDIAIQPEAASLRVLVRDSANGAVGSIEIPIGQLRKSKGKAE